MYDYFPQKNLAVKKNKIYLYEKIKDNLSFACEVFLLKTTFKLKDPFGARYKRRKITVKWLRELTVGKGSRSGKLSVKTS